MRVKSIRPAGTADVFNMEVEGTHDFAVNGGVIVHNCYDECRYMCMEYPVAQTIRIPAAVKPYSPLDADEPEDRDYAWFRKY
nr:MAG TPA: Intein splicing domain [Caudoviricetes sp.]